MSHQEYFLLLLVFGIITMVSIVFAVSLYLKIDFYKNKKESYKDKMIAQGKRIQELQGLLNSEINKYKELENQVKKIIDKK